MSKKTAKAEKMAMKGQKVTWTNISGVKNGQVPGDVRRLTIVSTAASGAAGVYSGNSVSGSSLNLTNEWSSLSSRWQEYRVLAIKMTFVPRYPVGYVSAATGATAYVNGLLYIATDRSGAGTYASVPALMSATGSKMYPTSKQVVYEARALDLDDQLFNDVGTLTSNFRIVFGLTDLAAATSVTHYDTLVEFMVEFRGIK